MWLLAEVITAVLLGPASHLALFIHGEWHMQAVILVEINFLCLTLLVVLEMWFREANFVSALFGSILVNFCFLGSLLISITIYRVVFHPLREFPGPSLASVTKFWHVFHCRDSRNHLLLQDLHRQYGDFVRTGMA